MAVKNRLKEIRHQMQIDHQVEMARLLGMPQQQYNRYERQEIQPTLEKALDISAKLNRSVNEIFYLNPGE